MHGNLTRPAAAAALALLLAGCAGTPDCGEPLAKAERAATERRPLAAWIGDVDTECRGRAEGRWTETLASDCEPLYGFHAGYSEIEAPSDCTGTAFVEARNLGELLGEIEREQARIEGRLDAGSLADGERAQLRQRLMVIERDRPQIEALARIQGYLPPADVPEAGEN
jgi:hypothetical protein